VGATAVVLTVKNGGDAAPHEAADAGVAVPTPVPAPVPAVDVPDAAELSKFVVDASVALPDAGAATPKRVPPVKKVEPQPELLPR
jgi:hypothetical protein